MFDRDQDPYWSRRVPDVRDRGPYEDYGWEPGESVLPEFRKPDVHLNSDEVRRMRAEREQNWERPDAPEYYRSGNRPANRRLPGMPRQFADEVEYGPFYGIGPRGYRRSDERILDDVNVRLHMHGWIDARDVAVDVHDGEVTLRGIVDDRRQKRLAEDLAASVMGVIDINNDLKVRSLLRERRAE
jgi:hypothetical protein